MHLYNCWFFPILSYFKRSLAMLIQPLISFLFEVMLFCAYNYRPSSLVFYFRKKSRKSQFPRIADRFSNNIRQGRRKLGRSASGAGGGIAPLNFVQNISKTFSSPSEVLGYVLALSPNIFSDLPMALHLQNWLHLTEQNWGLPELEMQQWN